MKKLACCLALISAGFLGNASAYVPYGVSSNSVVVPKYCGSLTFGIYGLFWRPAVPHLDYALVWDDINQLGEPTFGNGGEPISLNPSYNWGFKANVGYAFPGSGNDISVAFTDYDHDFFQSIGNPTPGFSLFMSLARGDLTSNTLGFVSPIVLVFPINELIAEIDASNLAIDLAEAKTDFAYQAWDFEFGKSISVGCDFRFRWYGGIRYVNLDHLLNADYTASFVSTVDDNPVDGASFTVIFNSELAVKQKCNFHGIGPRFGMGMNYYLSKYDFSTWCGCLSWIGISADISGSMLVGEINSSLKETFDREITGAIVPTPPPETDIVAETVSFSQNEVIDFHNPYLARIVPNFEGRAGINYNLVFNKHHLTKLTIEAGWAVTHYWNAVERLTSLGNSPEFRVRQSLDATFEGPYLGLQVNI